MSELIDKLVNELRSKNYNVSREKGRIKVKVALENFVEVVKKLKNMGIDHVKSLTAIDYPSEGRIKVNYILGSYSTKELYETIIIVSLDLSRDSPSLPSLAKMFPSIIYQERECYEMLGIEFKGHNDLRHLLLSSEDFTDVHPLRKEFKIEEEGIMA